MGVLTFLALVCFLTSAIWAGILRAWPTVFLALGLLLWLMAGDADFRLST